MTTEKSSASKLQTGLDVRRAARDQTLTSQTSGLAPTYLQANLLVLPSRYAADFRNLCARNPVPCPLLAESASPGEFARLKSYLPRQGKTAGDEGLRVADDLDLRNDFPLYRIYQAGQVVAEKPSIEAEWTSEHVGFLIGCSFSFEAALATAGLTPRHILQGRNVPMYRTRVPLCPAGVFQTSTYVVSMRPYKAEDVDKVRDITRRFAATHGEPIAWGWDGAERLGIADITRPEFGEHVLRLDGSGAFDRQETGYVPVFWGCGVTPQAAVMAAQLKGTVMAHSPGHMLVLDVRDQDVFPAISST